MDSKLTSYIVTPLVQLVCLTPLAILLVLPLLWRGIWALLGWYLRKRTDGRRCHILELTEADEKKYREDRRSSSSSGEGGESDGWEEVDASAAGTAKNGGKGGEDDWDGIVGFFHPFW